MEPERIFSATSYLACCHLVVIEFASLTIADAIVRLFQRHDAARSINRHRGRLPARRLASLLLVVLVAAAWPARPERRMWIEIN
jgi:hypothetical protein